MASSSAAVVPGGVSCHWPATSWYPGLIPHVFGDTPGPGVFGDTPGPGVFGDTPRPGVFGSGEEDIGVEYPFWVQR
jgi:hypothetical protein